MKGPVENHYNHEIMPQEDAPSGREDFSDYMWMGEEEIEDFDKKCVEQFWEDDMMQFYLEEMLEEEDQQWWYPQQQQQQQRQQQQQQNQREQQRDPIERDPIERDPIELDMQCLSLNGHSDEDASKSKLNPDAPVFVPRVLPPALPPTAPVVEER